MRRLRFFVLSAGAFALAAVLSGCAAVGVQVWERDVLSKPEMQMDSHALDRALDDHIYFSKEASSGGRSFGGGGCGCN
ncbi:MAG TPA: DUF4266 domain-containing protein [candidate division Zixibacteria bacterium]|nr:DUF4266 domain-containing protein [candidate division Zixibacteria bacterium]MDM7974175.1 DUF4266 domain-containing protein [candidate division Zixibacteria bacterium]HOD67347.1 DUF4266 domain-containing protein [candidate division Zixibacteria bacterium]HOZ09085.1 DUF4266 domain-containing protein [candidate division Zixibacteria bacterium]HPC11516.1 DUF4266 domain-containing protein [candidate division Zixibacteria bacterium]